LNHVELTLWGNLSLVYVGPQAEPHELVDELMRMKVTATAPTWVSLARAARLAGESDAAALALQAATALAQADADPHYLRDAAQEWRELGQPEVALPLYRMAGRRLPADPETLLGWGVSANAIGAADEVLRVLDTLPASEAHKYWPERLRGDAYRQKGQWEAAIAYYLAAETAQPGESAIAALLAMALDQAGDTTQAVLWWQQYLAREPVGPFKEQACRYLIEHGALPCIR
jgi:tetratricopeptide (TPR) repeat protein